MPYLALDTIRQQHYFVQQVAIKGTTSSFIAKLHGKSGDRLKLGLIDIDLDIASDKSAGTTNSAQSVLVSG